MKYQTIIYCAAGATLVLFLVEAIGALVAAFHFYALLGVATLEQTPKLQRLLHIQYGFVAYRLFVALLQMAVIFYTYRLQNAKSAA